MGFKLTVDQDSRYGTNNNTSAAMGNIVGNTNLGGEVHFDGTLVRLIPYNTGTGNVPASNTTISQGSASGKLIGVYSALNVAPTTAGSAMPASGYIKIKQWNGVAFAAGALTGITATATGADTAGWIEIVGVDAQTTTIPRRATLRATGEWYIVGTTDGNRATTYQIPSNGSTAFYLPGVWVETGSSTNNYEFYPCAGSQTALVANIATDSVRGKVCWISTAGLLRLGHDGTNSTGGYIPPSGRRIRVPNVFFMCATAATPTANVLPNATLATRYSTYSGTQGTVILDKVAMNWFFRTLNCFSISVNNSCFMTAIQHLGIKSAIAWDNIGVGQEAANAQIAVTLQLCYKGGTISNAVWTRATLAAGATIMSLQDVDGFTFTNNTLQALAARASANVQVGNFVHATNCVFTGLKINSGQMQISACSDLRFTNTTYWDQPGSSTTPITNGVVLFDLVAGGQDMIFDGVDFGGLFMQQPYLGILRTSSGHAYPGIKLRNLGTPSSPLDLGGPQRNNKAWTRATTTATVTDVAHGLKVNDNIYVVISDSTAAITVASKTVASVPTADTFTFTCLNAGAASGVLTYYPRVSGSLYLIGWGTSNLKVQRCYVPHVRTTLISDSGITTSETLVENVQSDYVLNQTFYGLDSYYKGLGNIGTIRSNAQQYGTHWVDEFVTGVPANMSGVSWTRATTTATVTSTGHNLQTGDVVIVTVSSDTAAITLGAKTITATSADAFTFTCLNAGGASGTLTFTPLNGRVGIIGCEPTALSADQVSVDSNVGTGIFTGTADSLYMPTVGNQVTWMTPYYIIGHESFPIAEAVMNNNGSGKSITDLNAFYALDKNDGNGFGSFKNLYYQRSGGGGSASSTNVTMTDTTGVSVGDYVWGTGIAPNAKVTSVTNSTTVVVDTANTGTVSGILRFNQLPSETVDAQLGFKVKLRLVTAVANPQTFSGFYFSTYSGTTARAYQYDLDPVTVQVEAHDLVTGADVVGASVYIEADTGGALPSYESVTITRSGTTATVSHTAHGVPTGTYVVIRGANQNEYNGSKRVTVVDANTYTFQVAGSPATPATGTITATSQILKANTGSDGIASTTFAYTADQPVTGWVRKGSSGTYYKEFAIEGTITEDGLSYLALLLKDQD